ncbi:hypothetical protein ARALYDRAFT_918479 [Arabidopsis lyrata subsp. lyrata]|uniref:KIB1-4 beta-propeller domain-containing protein n=1 Tax=Arabidopsis lyrata subsp. lyrata TaxID=81972 RepID=D7MTK0_ARALL|nr:uncharacterized protein LOC9300358 [Arabidopsis lyrata subsp. lyrata]EFH40541.1 hypothetical protein ARALYDRAFT_918479 [Arabidopsis lyrata subsp. lyrata]|eukprot:XP_002864282.1 uncharacterized protein LOC9300358 [Arabidopsis lyrata subsp. lyrata]
MSLLFGLVAKHYVEEGDTTRLCSYPLQTPYMLVNYSFEQDESTNEEENMFVSYNLFNLRSEKIIKITGKKFPKVLYQRFILLGTSRGWAVFMGMNDSTIYLSDIFNPWSSKSSPKTISLPPLAFPNFEMTINVSLSTPFPDHDNNSIVSITFCGSKLSYCMPNRDLEWTTINIPFSSDIDSHVVYSRKDQMFYLLSTGCAYMVTLDLKNNKNPTFMQLQFENFPLIPQHEWEILSSCSRSDYMMETSSGERFIIHWYVTYVEPTRNGNRTKIYGKTKRFMVFRIEKDDKYKGRRMIASYTDNIGDLCIFIGENEIFCLEACKYPGLKPNSIYYVSYGFGVYDISNRSAREYKLNDFPTFCGNACFLSPLLH